MGKLEDLIGAIRDQDLAAVIKLTGRFSKSKLIGSTKKLNINQLDGSATGLSPLHHAACLDSADIVKALIDHGATVDLMDTQGIRPLHMAARHGRYHVIRHLISCGSSVNDPAFDGSTPLHMAAEHGHLESVDLLLENHADPSAYNRDHKTAFDVACEFGHLKIVEKLASSSKCLSVRDYSQSVNDVQRSTCLHLATQNGHIQVLRFLLEAGADLNQQTVNGTCLHEAVLLGQVKAAKLLLEWGINLYTVNSMNQTAFDILRSSTKLGQNERLARLLTEAPYQPLTVRAIRPFHNPHSPHELSFREGDLIRVVERHSDRVWKGYLFKETASDVMPQRMGYFPSSEVEILRCSDPSQDRLYSVRLPSSLSSPSSQCSVSSYQCSSPGHLHPLVKSSPVTSSVDRTAEWIVHTTPCASSPSAATDQSDCSSGSPMSSKDNVSESNRSSTSSSSGSSGYLGSSSQVNNVCQLNRLSGQSCESGVASLWPSTHCLPASTSRSSHGGASLDWLDGGNGQPGPVSCGQPGPINVNELMKQGYKDDEVMHSWLSELQLVDCFPLFIQAGYDMPTISRMTPEDLTAIGITQPNIRKRLTSEISRLHVIDRIPNFSPGSLLEWLQLLNLDDYYNSLIHDGYTDIDRITEITWEDLEEIGIRKLGHQKKFMLAVDRIKKLGSGKQTNTEQELPRRHVEQHSAGTEPTASSAEHYHNLAGGKSRDELSVHLPHGSSRENLTRSKHQENKVPTAKVIVRLPPQTPYVPHAVGVVQPAPGVPLGPRVPFAVPQIPGTQRPAVMQPETTGIQLSPLTGSRAKKKKVPTATLR